MKPLALITAITLGAAPAMAGVDPSVHSSCKDAKDYQGCVKAFTSPAPEAANAELIAVPCAAGRPGRWLLSEKPKGVDRFMILKVNRLLPRDYSSHPFYDPKNPDLYEYATCAILPIK